MKCFADMSKNDDHQTSRAEQLQSEDIAFSLKNKASEPAKSIHAGTDATRALINVA